MILIVILLPENAKIVEVPIKIKNMFYVFVPRKINHFSSNGILIETPGGDEKFRKWYDDRFGVEFGKFGTKVLVCLTKIPCLFSDLEHF